MNSIVLAIAILAGVVGEPAKTESNPPPKTTLSKVTVEVTHDKFSKTITRVFRQDIGNAADKDDVELSLEATSVAPEKVLNAETPTNLFILIVRFSEPDGTHGAVQTGRRLMLEISCDGKPLEEVVKGKLPKPPHYAQQFPVIYGRRDCLLSAPRCSSSGRFWIPSSPMWIPGKGTCSGCAEDSIEGVRAAGDQLDVGFAFATEIVSVIGIPKKIECRVSFLSKDDERGAELGSFSIGPKQWNQIELFSKRIMTGR